MYQEVMIFCDAVNPLAYISLFQPFLKSLSNLFKSLFSSFKYGVSKATPQKSCTVEFVGRDLPVGWSTLPYNVTA